MHNKCIYIFFHYPLKKPFDNSISHHRDQSLQELQIINFQALSQKKMLHRLYLYSILTKPTGLEPATTGSTVRDSNQIELRLQITYVKKNTA